MDKPLDEIEYMISLNQGAVSLDASVSEDGNSTFVDLIEDEKIAEGRGSIALQIHSGGGIKVKWRNLKVKELD